MALLAPAPTNFTSCVNPDTRSPPAVAETMKRRAAFSFSLLPFFLNEQSPNGTLSCRAAEIMKRRVAGLHQNTAISSVQLTDHWEPKEEGLDPIETTRHVSVITIILSKVGCMLYFRRVVWHTSDITITISPSPKCGEETCGTTARHQAMRPSLQ